MSISLNSLSHKRPMTPTTPLSSEDEHRCPPPPQKTKRTDYYDFSESEFLGSGYLASASASDTDESVVNVAIRLLGQDENSTNPLANDNLGNRVTPNGAISPAAVMPPSFSPTFNEIMQLPEIVKSKDLAAIIKMHEEGVLQTASKVLLADAFKRALENKADEIIEFFLENYADLMLEGFLEENLESLLDLFIELEQPRNIQNVLNSRSLGSISDYTLQVKFEDAVDHDQPEIVNCFLQSNAAKRLSDAVLSWAVKESYRNESQEIFQHLVSYFNSNNKTELHEFAATFVFEK